MAVSCRLDLRVSSSTVGLLFHLAETAVFKFRKFLMPVSVLLVFSSLSRVSSLTTSSDRRSAQVLQPSSTFSRFSSFSSSSGRFFTRIVAIVDHLSYLDNPEYNCFWTSRALSYFRN